MRIKMLGKPVSSFSKPLKRAAENGFEVSLESGETPKCFRIVMSYCCNKFEEKEILSAWRAAGTQHPCVGCHNI